MITVRTADANDAPWMVGELAAFARFYGTKYSLFPETVEEAEAEAGELIANGVVFVAERDGEAVGFIAGESIQIRRLRLLHERYWWVMPEHRGTRAAAMLKLAFERWGIAHVDWILQCLLPHSPVKEDALLRRGYKLQERNFVREVTDADRHALRTGAKPPTDEQEYVGEDGG